MAKSNKYEIQSFITLEYEFSGIRLQDGFLSPVDWKLSVNLLVPNDKNKTRQEIEHRASIYYQRLYFWLDTNLPNVIMVDVNDEDDLYIANISSNIMMHCPGMTTDDLIIQMLHSKMTKIVDGNLIIGHVTLSANDTTLKFTFDTSGNHYHLPAKTEDYYSEGHAKDELPWWARNDGFCFEFIKPDGIEMTDEEFFNDIIDPMDEFERLAQEAVETQLGIHKEPAKIVQVEKWKPKKVD